MKLTVNKPVEVDAKWLLVYCGGRLDYYDFQIGDETYEGLEDFLKAYPNLRGLEGEHAEELCLKIDVETGEVINWPKGEAFEFYDWKVVDEGTYRLLDGLGKTIVEYQGYVPDCLGKGGYGDYFEFEINDKGFIPGWKFTQHYLNELLEIDDDD